MDEQGLRTHFLRKLGLSPGATLEEVAETCQRLLLEQPVEERAEEIYEAFRMITDQTALRDYIEQLGRLRPSSRLGDLDALYREIDTVAELAACAAGEEMRRKLERQRTEADSLRIFLEYVHASAIGSAKKYAERVIDREQDISASNIRELYAFARDAGARAAARVSNACKLELQSLPPADIIDEFIHMVKQWLKYWSRDDYTNEVSTRVFRKDYEDRLESTRLRR